MKFKKYTGITWSLLELSGLLEDEDARVCFEKAKKHYGLHPFHLTNLQAALNEILSSSLNTYDAELKGLLLAYKNPKLLTNLGDIFYDACFIHVDIEVDFYVFRPKVGCTLKGIVNKKGIDHIGVLTHKAFNVSIPNIESNDDWPGNDVEMGQEIRFTVTHLDFSSGLPFIRGSLDPENYLQGCKLVTRVNLTSHGDTSHTEDNCNAINQHVTKNYNGEFVETNEGQVIKETLRRKKNKKKKHLDKVEAVSDEEENDHREKCLKKSKEIDKVSRSEMIKAELSKQNHSVDTDDSEESTVFAKQKIIKVKNSISTNDTVVESEKEDKVFRKNRKKLSLLDSETSVLKIKQEKSTPIMTTSENIKQEHSSKKTKVKERRISNEYLDNVEQTAADDNVQKFLETSVKKRSKKFAVSESEPEQSTLAIKSEKISSKIKTIQETDNEAEASNTFRKKSKHHKRLREMDIEESEIESLRINSPKKQKHNLSIKSEKPLTKIKTIQETDNEAEMNNTVTKKSKKHARLIDVDIKEGDMKSLETNTPKKHSKKSSVHDSTLTSEVVKIKKEKINSGSNGTQNEGNKTKDLPDTDNGGHDIVESTGKNMSPEKSSEIYVQQIEYPYGKIKIKTEKLDDSKSDSLQKKRLSGENLPNSQLNANEEASSHIADVKGRSKKSVETDVCSNVVNIKIKTEKSFVNNSVEKETASPNDAKYNPEGSVKNISKEKKKHSKSSPKEHSRKSKAFNPELEASNIKIKTER